MARRFGRNQKRAMRREIAHQAEVLRYAEHQHARLVEQLDRTRAERTDLAYQLNLCKEALGEEFIGFHPVDAAMSARRAYGPSFRVAVGDNATQMMHVLDAAMCADSLDPAHRIHFKALLAGSEVGYCISEAALRGAPELVVVRQIAFHMAERLVGDIRAAPEPAHA